MRLKTEALHFKINRKNISELAQMNIQQLSDWLVNIEQKLTKSQNKIAKEILKEIRERIQFLLDVGLDYISLDRSAKTLSGGESQRIRLATQIGSQLVNVLYILDEPSIGLHQRDNQFFRLFGFLLAFILLSKLRTSAGFMGIRSTPHQLSSVLRLIILYPLVQVHQDALTDSLLMTKQHFLYIFLLKLPACVYLWLG
jgi:ABC-type phosphonate transport system ATPase subunit